MLHIVHHHGHGNLNNEIPLSHLLKWPQSGTLPTPNAGEDVVQHNTQSSLVGRKNGTATLEQFSGFLQE